MYVKDASPGGSDYKKEIKNKLSIYLTCNPRADYDPKLLITSIC
jgi:hypothetical protein